MSAAMLAPASVEGCSCHAGSTSSESSFDPLPPGTASDSSRGDRLATGSAQLWDDLAGEELDVVEIGLVEDLEVDPLDAGLGERIQLVRDLSGRAHQR